MLSGLEVGGGGRGGLENFLKGEMANFLNPTINTKSVSRIDKLQWGVVGRGGGRGVVGLGREGP